MSASDRRLWGSWALYNGLAFLIILGTVELLSVLSFDVTHGSALKGHSLGGIIVGVIGALFYSVVLGALQWRVVSKRVAVARRKWITVTAGTAIFVWAVAVMPAAVAAANSGDNVPQAYLLAVSQALALGSVLGIGQSWALRPYTTRWAWWIAATILSYLIVVAVVYLLSRIFGNLDFTHSDASTWEIFGILLLTTPLSGRALLWVTAPDAAVSTEPTVRPTPAGEHS